MDDIIKLIDEQRDRDKMVRIKDLLLLSQDQNVIYDPFSLLISTNVVLGHGNIFYPSVKILASGPKEVTIGDHNIFYSGTVIIAMDGVIVIGCNNQFGDGGCSILANRRGARISIGDGGRYVDGAKIMGKCELGSGSQVLGPISVVDCSLGEGQSYESLEPDKRGAVLKGFGIARGLTLRQGQVVNGAGAFLAKDLRNQSEFHPN